MYSCLYDGFAPQVPDQDKSPRYGSVKLDVVISAYALDEKLLLNEFIFRKFTSRPLRLMAFQPPFLIVRDVST